MIDRLQVIVTPVAERRGDRDAPWSERIGCGKSTHGSPQSETKHLRRDLLPLRHKSNGVAKLRIIINNNSHGSHLVTFVPSQFAFPAIIAQLKYVIKAKIEFAEGFFHFRNILPNPRDGLTGEKIRGFTFEFMDHENDFAPKRGGLGLEPPPLFDK